MTTKRVLRAIAEVSAWLDRAAVRCVHSLGEACLDGLAAYGMALHGLPPDSSRVDCCGEPQEEPIMPPDQRIDIGPKARTNNHAAGLTHRHRAKRPD
jgi:hypothetical protein